MRDKRKKQGKKTSESLAEGEPSSAKDAPTNGNHHHTKETDSQPPGGSPPKPKEPSPAAAKEPTPPKSPEEPSKSVNLPKPIETKPGAKPTKTQSLPTETQPSVQTAEPKIPATVPAKEKEGSDGGEVRFPNPIAWCIEPELSPRYCNYCMRPPEVGKSLLRCSGCKFAHFCNGRCQKAGWEAVGGHKAECQRLRDAFPQAPSFATLFFARLLDWLLANNIQYTLFCNARRRETMGRHIAESLRTGVIEDRRGAVH